MGISKWRRKVLDEERENQTYSPLFLSQTHARRAPTLSYSSVSLSLQAQKRERVPRYQLLPASFSPSSFQRSFPKAYVLTSRGGPVLIPQLFRSTSESRISYPREKVSRGSPMQHPDYTAAAVPFLAIFHSRLHHSRHTHTLRGKGELSLRPPKPALSKTSLSLCLSADQDAIPATSAA